MRLAPFRWLRTKLDEVRLHIPVDVRYVGNEPGGGVIVSAGPPRAMLMRRVVLHTTYEPRLARRWQIGSMAVDLNLELPWRWHLDNCAMVELSTRAMQITMHPVPVVYFRPEAPPMIHGLVLRGPLRIEVTVGGLAGLVRLFTGGRVMAEVEGTVAPTRARVKMPAGIESLFPFVDSMP